MTLRHDSLPKTKTLYFLLLCSYGQKNLRLGPPARAARRDHDHVRVLTPGTYAIAVMVLILIPWPAARVQRSESAATVWPDGPTRRRGRTSHNILPAKEPEKPA